MIAGRLDRIGHVRIGVDPALNPIPAIQLDTVVGQRAAMDLSAGGLVTEGSIAATVVPAQDMSVVGIAVPVALLPGEPLRRNIVPRGCWQ